MTDNDLQNITQKTKDRVTRIPLKTGLRQVFRKGGSSSSISCTGRVILVVLNMTSKSQDCRIQIESLNSAFDTTL
jgi:hypothetical protein